MTDSLLEVYPSSFKLVLLVAASAVAIFVGYVATTAEVLLYAGVALPWVSMYAVIKDLRPGRRSVANFGSIAWGLAVLLLPFPFLFVFAWLRHRQLVKR